MIGDRVLRFFILFQTNDVDVQNAAFDAAFGCQCVVVGLGAAGGLTSRRARAFAGSMNEQTPRHKAPVVGLGHLVL